MGLAAEGIITEESVNFRSIEIIQTIEIIQKRKIEKKINESFRDLWDIRGSEICDIRVQKKRGRSWVQKKKIEEVIVENSSNLVKDRQRSKTL